MKEQNFNNLPEAAVDYIQLVIRKMRYRKKVRADVMAELIAHFEDELADCATAEEKEKRVQRLIEDFGEAKLLGILCRRAKKRCRPLWRTIVARAFQLIALWFVLLLLQIALFLSGKPSITTNYIEEMNREVRPVADESLNAHPFYSRAAELYKSFEEKNRDKYGMLREVMKKDVPFSELSIEEQKLLVDSIEEVSESLDLISLGSEKPYYWQEYKTDSGENNEVIAILLPGLSVYRDLAYRMCWRAKIKAEDGDYKQAFDDLLICYRLGMHQKKGATLVEQLVGVSIEAKSIQALRSLLSTHKIPKAEILYYRDKLAKVVENESFGIEVKFEKYCGYDEIQRWYTGKRLGGLRGGAVCLKGIRRLADLTIGVDDNFVKVLRQMGIWSSPFHILFTHPNKEESFEMTTEYWDYWDKVVDKSPAQRRAEGVDVDKEAMEIIKGNILLELFAPALTKIIEISYRNKIEVESSLVLISILLYEQDFGRLPENLEELVSAGYLKTIAIDPFSDKPLVYRKTDDGFILYSVGSDFEDDGGVFGKGRSGKQKMWGAEGDVVFWPVGK